MIKFVDHVDPIKYVLTNENTLERVAEVLDLAVDEQIPNITPINELGRHLLVAVSNGDIHQVRSLLNQGCPFTSDWLGTSPIHLAAQSNKATICELLLKGGISKDARNKVDKTPLHLAAYEGHYDCCELLIRHGAEVDCIDMLEMTPLHWAVQNGHTDVVELLLQSGAPVKKKNKFDLIPQEIAIQINKPKIVELLQAYDNVAMVVQLQEDNQQNNVIEINDSDEGSGLEPIIIVNDGQFARIQEARPAAFTSNTTNFRLSKPEADSEGFSAVHLLQQHGITMIPHDNDEQSILNAVMENGHSVVLTDVGKEILNSVKQDEQKLVEPSKAKRIITITPEQFQALTGGGVNKTITVKDATKSNFRKVVMKKNRPTPYENKTKVLPVTRTKQIDHDSLIQQLIDAKKTIEEYKSKLRKKELEVERYKIQLRLLMNSN